MKVKNIMLCATAVVPSLAWAKELPNIIYIVTDQQTASAMSCMGNDDLHTPNMDKLAQAGVLFRNAYCSTPLSGPARAAMFSGYTSHEVGLARNGTPIPDSLRTRTLGTLMQNAGYAHMGVGSGKGVNKAEDAANAAISVLKRKRSLKPEMEV